MIWLPEEIVGKVTDWSMVNDMIPADDDREAETGLSNEICVIKIFLYFKED